MSAAPDWPTLLDYDAQFDAVLLGTPAAPGFLATFAADNSLQLLGPESAATATVPRLEYDFTLGPPVDRGGYPQLPDPAVASTAAAFSFTINFRFVFDRTAATAAARSTLRGAFRRLFDPGEDNFAALDYLAVIALAEVSSRRASYAPDESPRLYNVWETQWDGIAIVKPDSYPA